MEYNDAAEEAKELAKAMTEAIDHAHPAVQMLAHIMAVSAFICAQSNGGDAHRVAEGKRVFSTGVDIHIADMLRHLPEAERLAKEHLRTRFN
jgi:hypothetical protein